MKTTHSLTHSLRKLTFILISFFIIINANGQVPDCRNVKIKGPLLVCDTGTTTHHYHVFLPLTVIQYSWKVSPTNAGVTSTPQINQTDIVWNSNAVALHAILLYSYVLELTPGGPTISGTDTLFPQTCCTVPSGAHSIQDLDDEFVSGTTSTEKIFNSFNIIDPITNVGNCTFNNTTKQVFVNNGTYFIEGQLNLNTTQMVFTGTTLIMGSGAVIYTPFGSNLTSNSKGDFVATDCHFKGTSCGMWQGIVPTTDTKLYFSGVTIEDAEYAINWTGCWLALICDNTTFNNNYISIFSHPKISNQNSFQNLGNPAIAGGNTRFKNCFFDSNSPMVLPTFNGQRGIPIYQKPFAAMYYNDLAQNSSGSLKSIPFDENQNPAAICTIKNMPYGIYGVNSQIDVFNCRFINIQAPVGSSLGKIPNTAAIYSTVKTGSAPNQLNVGDDDIPGVSNLHNEFTDCYFGVRSQGNVNSKILYNIFTHDINVTNQTPSGRAIMLRDANNATIKVNHNNIIDHKIVSIPGSFNSTGIFISNSGQFNQNLEILSNSIDNNRIGIYLSNIKGNNLTTPDFHVAYNLINSTIPENQLIGTHFGMFLSKIDKALIEANTISRSQPLSTSPNFQTKMYGMNNVSCTNSIIAANYFHQYGTSMRYVGASGGTELHCNTMDNCIQGISLANASMSDQGSASDPWDNTWDGFPTPTNTTYNRVDGIATQFEWYNRGTSNLNGGSSNNYSPEPVFQALVHPNPLPGYIGTSCQSGGNSNSSFQHLLDIVTNNINYPNYPDEERYNDEEYAYQTLIQDSALMASENAFMQFIQDHSNSNHEYFHWVDDYVDNGNLQDAINLLNLLIDSNAIEHNKHFTKEIALRLLMDPEAEVSESEIEELEIIAWTSAWEGGNGVFTARHILDEEVFDVERNLRIGRHSEKSVTDLSISIYPNPVKGKAFIYFNFEIGSKIKLIVNDFIGRPVLITNLQDNIVDVCNLKQGIYSFNFFMNGNFHSSTKVAIVK